MIRSIACPACGHRTRARCTEPQPDGTTRVYRRCLSPICGKHWRFLRLPDRRSVEPRECLPHFVASLCKVPECSKPRGDKRTPFCHAHKKARQRARKRERNSARPA